MGKIIKDDKIQVSRGRGASHIVPFIGMIRFIAMLMIIICHLMQALDLELAQWFNVGVPIFLCISGFLYGQRNIGEITSFYFKRFAKIYIPFLISYIPLGLFQFAFEGSGINIITFIRGALLNDTILGGGHLWFVPTILVCYAITPILQSYRDRYFTNQPQVVFVTFIILAVETVYFGLFNRFFSPAWICCYTIGYVLGSNEGKSLVKRKHIFLWFCILAISFNAMQIYCDYIKHMTFPGYGHFVQYAHVTLGVALFLLMRFIFEGRDLNKFEHILDVSDKYSYEIYLVHAMVILGPFSLINLTPYLVVNILIILVVTSLIAYIIKHAANKVIGLCQVKFLK